MIAPDSPLAAAFWKSRIVEDCPVIDMHGHLGQIGRASCRETV